MVHPCITQAPPPRPEIKSTPCTFGLCYETYDAQKLTAWILDIWDWSMLNYEACK